LFRSSETKRHSSYSSVNQHFCHSCNEYLFPNGIESGRYNKICKCCGDIVQYVFTQLEFDELNKKIIQKPVLHSFTKNTFGRKNFDDFLEFIISNINLHTNYQLVVLKLITANKMCTKYELAEELAYQNNKDFENQEEVQKFLPSSVYDILGNHEFIKKINHNGDDKYILNIYLDEFQTIRCIEILEEKLKEYNIEYDIPANQFDPLNQELQK